MDFKRYHVPFTILVLSIVIAAAIIYTLPTKKPSEKPSSLQFPTGISPTLGSTSAIQINEEQFKTISVTGSGTASMQAEEATVTLGVQTEAESASEAVRLNAELMTGVIDAIKAFGITEDDMKTVSYSVSPVYARNDYNNLVGYRVINMIAVKITDLNLIGEVIDRAAENGANRIQGVSFGLSDESQKELKRKAYLAALEDAEEKAKLIAEKLSITITGVLYVSESSYQPYQPYYEYRVGIAGEMAPVPPTPIIEGKLSVSVTVHVIYSFE